jgi:hypothetical protein
MKTPKFILQSGPVLSLEKYACRASEYYPTTYCSFNDIPTLKADEEYMLVPVGSVEFVREFCNHFNISLPSESLSYYEPIQPYLHRQIRRTTLGEAHPAEFVKPVEVKKFTGDVKSKLRPLSPATEVWASPAVPFESEFRFYIQDYAYPGPKIVGWSRYDDLECVNPDPPIEWVKEIAQSIHDAVGPNAYTIDIGWRPDIQQYDVVELNDAWALGLYRHGGDEQSSPPSYEDYAEMLVSRWRQILFCSFIDTNTYFY